MISAPLQLSLTLFVPGIAANHVQAPMSPHQFAVFANALHAGSNLHRPLPGALGAKKSRNQDFIERQTSEQGEKSEIWLAKRGWVGLTPRKRLSWGRFQNLSFRERTSSLRRSTGGRNITGAGPAENSLCASLARLAARAVLSFSLRQVEVQCLGLDGLL